MPNTPHVDWVAFLSVLTGFLLGAMGLFLTYRARMSPLREELYRVQVELTLQIVDHGFDALRQVEILYGADTAQRNTLRASTRDAVHGLIRASWRGLALLPAQCSREANLTGGFLIALAELDHPKDKFEGIMKLAREHHWEFIRLARIELGVEPLSKDTQMLMPREKK